MEYLIKHTVLLGYINAERCIPAERAVKNVLYPAWEDRILKVAKEVLRVRLVQFHGFMGYLASSEALLTGYE